jgi:DNA-directed RNA polymerase subunit N (RpoN/RPB10)
MRAHVDTILQCSVGREISKSRQILLWWGKKANYATTLSRKRCVKRFQKVEEGVGKEEIFHYIGTKRYLCKYPTLAKRQYMQTYLNP